MPEGVNTTAIYILTENGVTNYFYSYNAGGLSFPFHIYGKAKDIAAVIRNNGLQETVKIKDILPMMMTDEHFYTDHRNQYLFRPLSEISAFQHLDCFRQGNDYGYVCTLDYDEQTVGVEINRNIVHTDIREIKAAYDDPKVIKLLSMDCADTADRETEFRNAFTEPPKPSKNHNMSVHLEYDGRHFFTSLPIYEDGIETAKINLGVHDLDDCEVTVDINNRYLNAIAGIRDAYFTALNDIADWADCADKEDLKKFSAAVQAYEPTTIRGIEQILDNLDSFDLVEVSCPEEYGREALYGCNSRADQTQYFSETVADYIDFQTYGEDLIESDGAIETDYGYIYSEDFFGLDESPAMQM